MSQELERVYTIPLGKVLLSPDNQRAKRAINMIKEFARKHMKTQDVRIDEDVNHLVWSRGIRRPPRKIRVLLTKTEEGHILVSMYEEEKSETKEVKTSLKLTSQRKQSLKLTSQRKQSLKLTSQKRNQNNFLTLVVEDRVYNQYWILVHPNQQSSLMGLFLVDHNYQILFHH